MALFIRHGMAQGWVPNNPSLNQIGFGVEIVSTNGQDARFDFTGVFVLFEFDIDILLHPQISPLLLVPLGLRQSREH
jgi:hypothetical protein